MNNFVAYNPTRLLFGKGVINSLPEQISNYGKNVLLVYGKGSIKKNGLYTEITSILKNAGKNIFEYEGIKPNPLVTDVEKAVKKGIENNVDFVLAVGGGSVIDSAKIISLCIPGNSDPWKVMKFQVKPKTALPLVTVLTLAATGTEMNQFAVLQNEITKEKIGFGSALIYPAISFCDPSYTSSVSKEYTAFGIADIIAHALEGYFGEGETVLSDRFVAAIIREMAEAGPALLNDLTNYELRARIMWASTCALNGLTFYGRKSGDWGVHDMGHVLSLLYDVPHGATLSIIFPAWMKYHSDRLSERIQWLGKEVFGTVTTDESIEAFENLFINLRCPVRIEQAGIENSKKSDIIRQMIKNEVSGMAVKLDSKAIEGIVNLI